MFVGSPCQYLLIGVIVLHACLFACCYQPQYDMSVVAGGGSSIGDGLLATQALLSVPSGGIVVSNSDIIFCDTNNHRIRKIDVNGMIAGTGVANYSGKFIDFTLFNNFGQLTCMCNSNRRWRSCSECTTKLTSRNWNTINWCHCIFRYIKSLY